MYLLVTQKRGKQLFWKENATLHGNAEYVDWRSVLFTNANWGIIINYMNAFGGINCHFDNGKEIIFPNSVFIPDLQFPDMGSLMM